MCALLHLVACLQVVLDLDHPEAQQALLAMQGDASAQKPSGHALSASVRQAAAAEQHRPIQQNPAGAAELQQGTPPVEAGMRTRRHISAPPAAAEASTECFARLEALAGQPEGSCGVRCLLNIAL